MLSSTSHCIYSDLPIMFLHAQSHCLTTLCVCLHSLLQGQCTMTSVPKLPLQASHQSKSYCSILTLSISATVNWTPQNTGFLPENGHSLVFETLSLIKTRVMDNVHKIYRSSWFVTHKFTWIYLPSSQCYQGTMNTVPINNEIPERNCRIQDTVLMWWNPQF
jgi:hypothetical protein